MASQRDIKRRIRSIKSTAQITKAMQMVAAARMRRAQQRVASSRPYSEHIRSIVADISGKSGAETHPLLVQRPVRAAEIITITPDRGLAGALVANLNRETFRLVQSMNAPTRIVAVGRKGRAFAVRARLDLIAEFSGLPDNATILEMRPIAQQVLQDYEAGNCDVVHLVYTRFINTLRQQAVSVQLLPLLPPEEGAVSGPWSYEPDNPSAVLSELLPRYIEFTIYQALLESLASEHSARMVAMRNATDNANDIIKDLTLEMNKARQAEITKEIAEISGAAEAIRTG